MSEQYHAKIQSEQYYAKIRWEQFHAKVQSEQYYAKIQSEQYHAKIQKIIVELDNLGNNTIFTYIVRVGGCAIHEKNMHLCSTYFGMCFRSN